mmetsp:Transcript_24012/g.36344  ORF Transcript_24012/g.36344 Transcript_24012/m.36344 type:complete len:205 (-) Transcript_24012:27-641(-)
MIGVSDTDTPQSTLHCGLCGKHISFCACKGLEEGEGTYFVLPKVADDMSFRLRLERWATLVKLHPRLVHFNAIRMIMDYPLTVEDDFKAVRPTFQKLIDEYKKSDALKHLEKTMKIPAILFSQVSQDCDFAMENLFSGNWGHIKLFEYVLLSNAFQESKPTDFNPNLKEQYQFVFQAVCGVLDMYDKVGVKDLNWQLEDIPRLK